MPITSTCVGTEKHKGCGKEKKILCRGLCSVCYKNHHASGFQEAPSPSRAGHWQPGLTRGKVRAVCLACKEPKPHYGRGLCLSCYKNGWEGPVKTCTACGEDKPHQALGMCSKCYMVSKATVYNANRRDALAALGPERRAELAAHHRTYRKVRLYGLSAEQQMEMEASQDRKCAICKGDFGTGIHYCHVDHCHVTGKVRGLLCPKCNRGLGQFKDNIESLKAAICYLERGGVDNHPLIASGQSRGPVGESCRGL